MKLFVFALLALVAVASAHTFNKCPGVAGSLAISSVTLTPDSPVPGKDLNVQFTGVSDQVITGGTAILTVKVFGVQIASVDFPLCKLAACPINGSFVGKIDYTIPSEAPAGITADCQIDIKDASGNELDCIDLDATISSSYSGKSQKYLPAPKAVNNDFLLDVTGVGSDADSTVCWKGTYGRGVGTIPEFCDPAKGLEKNGALCYPVCKANFYGVGPVCWEHCKPGWVDEGALCRKSGSIETVVKATYGRGVGHLMGCQAGHEEDAALCYPVCKTGFYGVGPVCWESCPSVDPVTGGAICCRDGTTCSDKIKALAGGLPLAVMKAILAGDDPKAIEQAVIDALQSVLGFIMPLCSTL